MSNESKSGMGVVVATAVSITIVVGAGLLTLPGLSFAMAGSLGYMPWIVVAIIMVPLLEIFAFFAREMPSTGGVVGYARASLGPGVGAVAEVIVLGTFSLGIPAIALIGAAYLQQSMPALSLPAAAAGVLTLAYIAGVVGLRISGPIQTAIAAIIVLGLLAIATGYLLSAPSGPVLDLEALGSQVALHGVAMAVPVVLFAFTGWEMTAFLAEDMKDPRRTMPLSIWASFLIVTFLYVFIAWVVAGHAVHEDGWRHAPFVQLASGWLGSVGGQVVAFIASLLVVANVVAAFLAASRAVFSAGRDGLLPRRLASLDHRRQPLVAMSCTYALFMGVVAISHAAGWGIDSLLQLAGQNFFFLYLCAAVGYARLHRGQPRRWVAYAAILSVVAMVPLFSLPGVLYCAALAAIGGLAVAFKGRSSTRPA